MKHWKYEAFFLLYERDTHLNETMVLCNCHRNGSAGDETIKMIEMVDAEENDYEELVAGETG